MSSVSAGGLSASPAAAGLASRSISASSSLQQVAEDSLFAIVLEDLTFTQDGKLETQRALMEELLESLRREEKLLDADAWKYAAPRSQLHLTSMSGQRPFLSYQASQLRVLKRKRPCSTSNTGDIK